MSKGLHPTARRNILRLHFGLLLVAVFAGSAGADDHARDDELWSKADAAYRSGNKEAGHIHLRTLIEENPGDVDLAVRCLDKMREAAGRDDINNPWVKYAVRRLAALERMGAISANTRAVQQAVQTHTTALTQDGRLFEAAEEVRRRAAANRHDVFWGILRAQVLRRLDSRETRALYEKLKAEMDLDHPDQQTRHRWTPISAELQSDLKQLPAPIEPLPDGGPLTLLTLDDPDGRWQTVASRSPQQVANTVDYLAGHAMLENQILLWRDMSGVIDPARALDLHLLNQPADEMVTLRDLQATSFAQEDVSASPRESEVLALYRRYRWALPAQRLLLRQANTALLEGRTQSALRSFQDVLDHAADKKLRSEAQVGYWTALAQVSQPAQIAGWFRDIDPQTIFHWMGKPATAAEIRDGLLARRTETKPSESPALTDLQLHVVRVPPVSPWPAETPTGGASIDMKVAGQDLLVSGRNLLAAYNAQAPGKPVWTSLQRHPAEQQSPGGYHPGYFRPTVAGDVLYSRWGFTSLPTGIAAFERSTGKPLWSYEPPPYSPQRRREFHVPMGDPLLSDGMLYYLQWNTTDNVNQNRGRRLTLVCFDPLRRKKRWSSTIVESGLSHDILATFEKAAPQSAIYGNRVTVHKGAVYSNSNAGIIAMSDVRDGRTGWIHCYRRGNLSPEHLGSAPIVCGDTIICMPRDGGGRVFALDHRTGRLLWENTQTLGVEVLGVFLDMIIVRGQTAFSALDVATGEPHWYLPITSPVVGRAQLIGESVNFAQAKTIQRLDAATGRVTEVRPWELADERPRSFAIHGDHLYAVTDKPAEDARAKLGVPLNPAAPQSMPLALPLQRAWTLPRSDAVVSLPDSGSPLAGKAYLLSSGMLECVDVSPQGSIHWRRFTNSRHPTIHFCDTSLLLIERRGGHVLSNHVVALDGRNGAVLWDAPLAGAQHQLIRCGTNLVFHDSRGQMRGINLATGRQVWERVLGLGEQMRLTWDGTGLHALYVSSERVAWHLKLDPTTGGTLEESRLETGLKSGKATNGDLVDDGYYEVLIDPVEARYLRLVALSEINGQGWTSIAELQAVGADGKNASRRDWKAVYVDSMETMSRFDCRPETVFDDDPVTWWHTKWKGGIPRHPHEIQIDLGAKQTIQGIRYLPAVIINNNGMIRDYELFVSNNLEDWGDPVAKGVLVNRVRIERPTFAQHAIFFEARNYQHGHRMDVFRYGLDGQAAKVIQENARLVAAGGPYAVISTRVENKDVLVVLRSDDPKYRFELTSEHPMHREGEIQIEGDRLILGRRSFVVADLAQRRFIVPPTPDNQKHNRSGLLFRASAHNLLKIVNLGGQGQALFAVDMQTGTQTESALSHQTEAFRHGPTPTLQRFNRVVLLSDGASVSAWITGEERPLLNSGG